MRTYDSRSAAELFGVDGWFKASASDANGTGCVEVNFARVPSDSWFKASASNANGTGCVEVTFGQPGVVGLRDSKNPDGGAFAFTAAEWRAFRAHVSRD